MSRSVLAVVSRSVPAVESRSVPAVESRSVPAVESRSVPAVESRSVPAVESRSVPAVESRSTILLGLPKDIYAAIDSCETAQEIWLQVQQMIKGSDIGIQEKKAKLFNE
nr:protein FAR1-related sequence 3 isoform X1 [Tanacetum cinerariifolium]